MKKKSINISASTPLQRFVWIFAFLIMVAFSFIFIYAKNHWVVTNGQFGDLLSGTIGVGASIGAMLFIIVTLVEQRKMNKQIEVHHLVESFNSVFDRLIHLFNSNSDVEEDSSIKVKKHLEYLWHGEDGIQSILSLITNKIREQTGTNLLTLQKLSQDEDLTRVSRTLNRLLSIKTKISELDIEAVRRVDDDWESIPQIWKEYAGFYFGWHSIDFRKSKENILSNEMIKLFSEQNDEKLLAFIPRIKILKQEEIFKVSEDEFAKQHFQIDSENNCDLLIASITFSGYSGQGYAAQHKTIPVNVVVKPQSSNIFSFNELFGDNIEIAFKHINGFLHNNGNRSQLYQDICLKYLGNEWVYENKLEFNPYPNNHASILFQEITE
jgi:hypothetical protein